MLIVAVDANFRLKNLHCSNDKADPGLHTGLAYFVEEAPYHNHYKRFALQKDVCQFLSPEFTGTNTVCRSVHAVDFIS